MTPDNSSYLDYSESANQSDSDLARLSRMANEQADAEAEIARLNALLTKATERLKDISERQLPEIMDKLGMVDFKTSTGLAIEIDETVRASIPKARSNEAMAWLRANGHEALIKRAVSVDFSRGEDEKARALTTLLAQQGYDPDDKQSVHSQTLAAWCREKLKKGEDFPLDLFGVFRQRAAKIKAA